MMDITKLKNEYIFVVNEFHRHKDFEKLNPTFYGCIEPMKSILKFPTDSYGHPSNWYKQIDKIYADKGTKFFFRVDAFNHITHHGLMKNKEIYYLLAYKSSLGPEPMIADITKGNSFMDASATYQIAVCAYMGFKELYLIGFDFDMHIQKSYKYFYEPEYGFKDPVDGWSNMQLANHLFLGLKRMQKVKDYFEPKGVKIYNAGLGGYLDTFDRFDYEKIKFK
jgi:hypothetical protein